MYGESVERADAKKATSMDGRRKEGEGSNEVGLILILPPSFNMRHITLVPRPMLRLASARQAPDYPTL
jgi:hypothetical protein